MADSPMRLVSEFHRTFELLSNPEPVLVDEGTRELRATLIEEEAAEAAEALRGDDLAHIAHELADVIYVAYGAALTLGIDLDAAVAEIHRANMSKVGEDGTVLRREDGKVLKGSNFKPADVGSVLRGPAGLV